MRLLKSQRTLLDGTYLDANRKAQKSSSINKPKFGNFSLVAPNAYLSIIDWHKVQRAARGRRIVCLVNLSVIVLLAWQLISIVRLGGDSRMAQNVLQTKRNDELPYPLNLARLVPGKMKPLDETLAIAGPGYSTVRAGTFRNKYPSTTIAGSGTFDAVYVVTSARCGKQWEVFRKLCEAHGIPSIRWIQTDARRISFAAPPVPLAGGVTGGSRAATAVLKRQLAYTDAHRRLWRRVIDMRQQRVLVIDDTLFPTPRLLRLLPATLSDIDTESVARQTPWHFIFLRRSLLPDMHPGQREAIWTVASRYDHKVTLANVSHGAGAYVLSLDGAIFLLNHVTVFRAPLDVEMGLLQHEHRSNFIALSLCSDTSDAPFCPKMIQDISTGKSSSLECTWRRAQELQTAGGFVELVVAKRSHLF